MENKVKEFRNILADSIATDIKENRCYSIEAATKIVEYELVEDLLQAIIGNTFDSVYIDNDTMYSKFHDKICNFVDDMVKEFNH